MSELIIYTSLGSLGFFIAGQQGYILYPVRNLFATMLGGVYVCYLGEWYYEFENKFASWIWKPIWGCSTCMSSVWGIVVYSLFSSFHVETIYELPVLILCSCTLNFIIFNNMIKKWLND